MFYLCVSEPKVCFVGEILGTARVRRVDTIKIFNPPFPVLKAGHSVSYSCVCDACREWVNEVGFFLFFLVWLVGYAHGFHVSYLPEFLLGRRVSLEQ